MPCIFVKAFPVVNRVHARQFLLAAFTPLENTNMRPNKKQSGTQHLSQLNERYLTVIPIFTRNNDGAMELHVLNVAALNAANAPAAGFYWEIYEHQDCEH